MFQQPPPSAGFIKIGEFKDSLVIIYARRYHEDMPGNDGKPFDGVEVELHALDGPKAGTVELGILTPKVLVGSLRNAIGGDPVLGRVTQGIANPGKSAPWILSEHTAADAQNAMAYLARVKPGIQQPAAAAPAPAPAAPAYPPPAPVPAPAPPAAPANGAMTASQFAALPLEVQELLRQSGQAPAA